MPLADDDGRARTNESFGMTVEQVLCDLSGLDASSFAHRAIPELAERIRPALAEAIQELPRFVAHEGAERGARGGQSKSNVDFRLEGGQTLSVKSTLKRSGGKVCPPEVGQPGMETYSAYFGSLYVAEQRSPDGLIRPEAFRTVAQERIVDKLEIYLRHLFDCDFLLWVWLQPSSGHLVIPRAALPQVRWDRERFSFSRPPETWNESCSVRYRTLDPDKGVVRDIPIGEFQIHEHRANYKFRVVLPNLHKILRSEGLA